MNKILFPDSNGFMIIVEGFVAVRQTEQGIIVSRVIGETFCVVVYCVFVVGLLAFTVTESYKSVVVVFFYIKNLSETGNGFVCFVVFKKIVAFF